MSAPPKHSHGVLVVDKPEGPTSHDVTMRLRRTLWTKRIGHAGTLDPMASGVLVMLIGEATKLGPYLTAHDKRYDARVVLGRATDTLDAMGKVVEEAPAPAWLVEEALAFQDLGEGSRIKRALASELARTQQTPPAFSAISVDGERSYDRARRGETVELAPRAVEVLGIELLRAGLLEGSLVFLDVSLHVSKGYYVRSFAFDLGKALETPAHLASLRRTQSGPFSLTQAQALDAPRQTLLDAMIPLPEAARLGLPTAVLSAEGVIRASHGKRLRDADFTGLPPPKNGPSGWLSPEGRLVAVGVSEQDCFVVARGFVDVAEAG